MKFIKSSLMKIMISLTMMLIAILVFVFTQKINDLPSSTLLSDYSSTVFDSIMSDEYFYLHADKLSMQENGLDYENYWVQAAIGITGVLEDGATDDMLSIINCMMDTFERNGYFPRPKYKNLPYGWVSSMDAPVIAVLAQLIYEETGDTKYQDFVTALSEYMTKDVSEHGYIAQVNGKPWLFEYADVNTTAETG